MIPGTLAFASSPVVGTLPSAALASAVSDLGIKTTVPSAPPMLDPWLDELAAAAVHTERPLVLLGFSFAGPRLFAAGQRTGADALVFIDAHLPVDGVSSVQRKPRSAELLEAHARPDWLVAPWPHRWGDEVIAELIPEAELRRRFVAECPPLPPGHV